MFGFVGKAIGLNIIFIWSATMFNCPNLQAIFKERKNVFDLSKEYMNSISDDIATLEKLLATHNTPSDHVHKIGTTRYDNPYDHTDSRVVKLFQEYEGHPGDNLIIEEQILWSAEKKRLFYVERVSKESGDYNAILGPKFPFIEITNKPLMETKFSIKKRIHPYLANIINNAALEFGYLPSKSRPQGFDDDLPF